MKQEEARAIVANLLAEAATNELLKHIGGAGVDYSDASVRKLKDASAYLIDHLHKRFRIAEHLRLKR